MDAKNLALPLGCLGVGLVGLFGGDAGYKNGVMICLSEEQLRNIYNHILYMTLFV